MKPGEGKPKSAVPMRVAMRRRSRDSGRPARSNGLRRRWQRSMVVVFCGENDGLALGKETDREPVTAKKGYGRGNAEKVRAMEEETRQYRVINKQPNSSMCLVCGLKNDHGLHASFYELENGELLAVFRPGEKHQSYPGRLHGGIVSTILDETIGRAIMINRQGELWGVTVEITVRFRHPVPLGVELRAIGRITRDGRRIFEGTGELLLPDGTVAAEGRGRYLKQPLDQIADFNVEEQEWKAVPGPDDPRFVELRKGSGGE